MRAAPRSDDMRARPRRAASVSEVQEWWEAPGCDATTDCDAPATCAGEGMMRAGGVASGEEIADACSDTKSRKPLAGIW